MRLALGRNFRRQAQVLLAQRPPVYVRVLRWTGRGSVEKMAYVALLERDDVVFDVGASVGYFTLLFSDLVGPGGEVHAFEPLPPTFARLREAMDGGRRFDNVRLNNAACAEHACEILLHVPDGDAAQASLRPQQDGSWRQAGAVTQLPVQAIRLDDYDRGRSGERVDFVKCDVEGAELLALRGMLTKLSRFRPLLWVEAFAGWTVPFGYEPATLVAFLESVGYDAFYLVTDQVTPMCDAYATVAAAAAHESVNLLCAERNRHGPRLRRLEWLNTCPGNEA